jgi:hypothetical protein
MKALFDRHHIQDNRRLAIGIALSILLLGVWGCSQWLRSPPHIQVSTTLHDFGQIREKDKVETLVTVKNTGGRELEILKVTTSCGCTQATIENEKLASGQETPLKITFDASTHHSQGTTDPSVPEPISHIVYLRSNDPAQPEVAVEIQAQIIHPKGLP